MAVNWMRKQLIRAQTTDLIFVGYVAVTGLMLMFLGRKLGIGMWLLLTAAHVALVTVGLWRPGRQTTHPSVLGFLYGVFPLLFIGYLYWELRYVSQLFHAGYNDAIIIALEEALFGKQLAIEFSQLYPQVWLSELLHLCYAFYWVLLPVALTALYLRRRFDGFQELVYVECVVYFGCYLVFIFFPVAGPHYQFPIIDGPQATGPLYQFVHRVLENGGSKGAAFPSSHVAVAVAVLIVLWRHDRALFAWLVPFVVGLVVGTVYGRFHYGVDTLAGLLAAFVLVWMSRWVRWQHQRRQRVHEVFPNLLAERAGSGDS